MSVTFNTLKLSRDSSVLSLSVSSTSAISRIVIDDQDTYSGDPTVPSSSPVYDYTPSEKVTKVSLEITKDAANKPWGNRLLIVYVVTEEGTFANYAFNWFNIHYMGMKFTNGLLKTGCCHPPMGFIDFVLRTKSFEFSLEAGNFSNAIKLWKTYFGDNSIQSSSDCGCKS